VIVAVNQGGDRRKMFQLMFLKDGSLTVSFPYFKEAACQLAIGTMPPAPMPPKISLGERLWGSSHRVKYTHHVDGRVHFSQDGKIRTVVRRQAIPLTAADGHLFTVQLQGLSAFKALPTDQLHPPNVSRANAVFEINGAPTDSLKFLGRIHSRDRLIHSLVSIKAPVGPRMVLQSPDGRRHMSIMMAAPNHPDRLLFITAEAIPLLNQDGPTITFIGGFDPPEIVFDHGVPSDFLFMASPAGDLEKVFREHGTVDFTPRS
jgi:hypothetical protein